MEKARRNESQPENSRIRDLEAQETAKMLLKEKLTTGDRAKLTRLFRKREYLRDYFDYAFKAGRISEYQYYDLAIKFEQGAD